MENRDGIIIKTSIVGIVANVFLAVFKAAVGLLSNSIAVVLDAVNNLSDALSSIITIVGTKLAGKSPDKKHPLGYGRIEYLTATLISFIVLYAGITSFKESVSSILSPSKPDYSSVALVIIVVGVIVKVVLGRYVKGIGEKVNSDSLINSGEDATLDSIISASTLLAAAIYIFTGVSLEAYLGLIISVVIIKSAIDMLKDALSDILGERVAADLAKDVKNTINSVDGVKGSYDLILHSYGPDRFLGSVHVEVDEDMSAHDIDEMTRCIDEKVYINTGVILTGVSIYAINNSDDLIRTIRNEVTHIVTSYDDVLQMHGFHLDKEEKAIKFDVIIKYEAEDRKKTFADIYQEVSAKYPDYTLVIQDDYDISD